MENLILVHAYLRMRQFSEKHFSYCFGFLLILSHASHLWCFPSEKIIPPGVKEEQNRDNVATYTHPLHLFNCSLTQISYQPITRQQLKAFRHVDVVKMTS